MSPKNEPAPKNFTHVMGDDQLYRPEAPYWVPRDRGRIFLSGNAKGKTLAVNWCWWSMAKIAATATSARDRQAPSKRHCDGEAPLIYREFVD
jgi:hypothetical protein